MRPFLMLPVLLLFATPALADAPPPAGSMAVSAIAAKVEKWPDVAYIEKIDWDDGYYEVDYRDKAGKEHEVKLDPKTGEERKKAR